jgi:hypothetical protein
MMMTLPMIISEQSLLKFTGRVNMLVATDNQYVGAIIFKEGEIVHAKFKEHFAIRALENIITEDYRNSSKASFKYIIEPEVIFDQEHSFSMDSEKFNQLVSKLHSQYDELLKLKPPGALQIKANAAFLHRGEEITTNEFDLLKILTTKQTVSSIIDNAESTEFELLESLISLRRKGALRVSDENNVTS